MAQLATRDGRAWVPAYLDSIDPRACIGCGRCYKVCSRSVMEPASVESDDDEDEDEDDVTSTVMSVADAGACIGCEACAKVCAKKAHRHIAG